MRKIKNSLIVVLLLAGLAVNANAVQYFNYSQPVNGYASSDWSFMTAWNLYTGEFKAGSDWYSGTYTLFYNLPNYNWVALFVYDDGTQRTRELCWSWCQSHIQ